MAFGVLSPFSHLNTCICSPKRFEFAPSCVSASSDRAGATTVGLATAEDEEEAELDNIPFVQLSSDILRTELSLLKTDAPLAHGDSSLGITALEDGDGEDGRFSGGRETAAYQAAMNAVVRLVASTAVDRLSCISLSVIAERDFVVQLAGEGRPIALAPANAVLSRVDLLCETAGASIFAVLLSRNDPVTCVRLSCAISLCALLLLFFLGGAMNRLADSIFDRSTDSASSAARSSA